MALDKIGLWLVICCVSTACPEQIALFDLGIDIARVRIAREKLMAAVKATNTISAYASSLRAFTAWCAGAGRPSLPATSETVSLFVVWSIDDRRLCLETVKLRLSAISHYHREACQASPVDGDVLALVADAARLLRESPAGKAALAPRQLRRVSARLLRDGSPIAVRDRAMLVLGFALGWRGSELSAIRLSDVCFGSKGVRVYQAASKTDQEGRGRVVGLPYGDRDVTCPVRVLRA